MNMWAAQIQSAMTRRPDVSVENSHEPDADRKKRLVEAARVSNRRRREDTNAAVFAVIQRLGQACNHDISTEIGNTQTNNYVNEVTRRLRDEGRIEVARKGAAGRIYWRVVA